MTIREITKIIYVYDISNPPLPDRTADVEIIINNSQNISLSNSTIEGQISRYEMTITDPKSLGLDDIERNRDNKRISDILLAFNLLMRCGVMLIHGANMHDNVIKYEPEEPKQPKIESKGSSHKITLYDTIRFTDSVKIGTMFKEEIDENELKQILVLIQNLDSKSTRESDQLKKALASYGSAMSSFDRCTIFKNLFDALALATNSDGNERLPDVFSAEIAAITNEKQDMIGKWREFNNRTKHIDKNPNHDKKYKEGMKEMPSWISPLRLAAQKIILAKLGQLYNSA